ncbi:MAG: ABC transporter ATP-binding protein [Pyrinomonadaceae bacterium]
MDDIVVAFEKVSKTYISFDVVLALDSVDLTIRRKERIAVMGPSGSGKSTLLNIMCGLDEPTSGHVLIEHQDLFAMDDDARTRLRRQKIGMIFQTFNLMPTLNGLENVALPLRLNRVSARESLERAAKMLDRVGLLSRGTHRPDEMSGGERQRVAVARALIFDPPVLLADEPTGNLDSKTGDEILHLLDDIHDEFGTTLVLVTHNELAASHCDRRVTLLDGRIVSEVAITGQPAAI